MESQSQQAKTYTVSDVNIKLNQNEQQIFETLMGVVQSKNLKTQLRVAGGWVRDKIMGKESSDIDISLDDMTGEAFAELVKDTIGSKFGVIKANPDQSKHLQVATMKIHGTWIDLLNLRSEKYSEESRIPQMEIGTPKEDALRRDLTINALFYNINTKQVEDFTERGIEDLRNGVIRTPLHSFQTFMDDPLRILRAIRFATRFSFKIDADILEAASDLKVRQQLAEKVSNERLGKEMDLMLEGNNPANAIELLYKFGILNLIYKFPPNCSELIKNQELIQKLIEQSVQVSVILGKLFLAMKSIQEDKFNFLGLNYAKGPEESDLKNFKEFQKEVFYSALMKPFSQYEYKAKNKVEKVVDKIIIDSLKKSNDMLKFMKGTIYFVDKAIEFANYVEENKQLGGGNTKLELGLYLREAGHHWNAITLLAFAQNYCLLKQKQDGMIDESKETEQIMNLQGFDEQLFEMLINRYIVLNKIIEENHLKDVHIWKPIIDGGSLQQLYEMKAGKWLKGVLDEQLKFQILNHNAQFEDAKVYLLGNKSEFVAKYS